MTPKFTPSNTSKTIRRLIEHIDKATVDSFDLIAIRHVLHEHAEACEQLEGWRPVQPQPEQPTLRDWLAMHATEQDIAGIYHPWSCTGPYTDYTREEKRYVFADRMLAARKGVQT